MDERVITPRMKGFIALDSHPTGCARNVARLVEGIGSPVVEGDGGLGGTVVVLGSSGGYGLPAAVAAAFRYRAPVVGVCLERPAARGRTASAGWYHTAALHRIAVERGVHVEAVNDDCFADATKEDVIERLRRLGPASLLVYSVAAPVRTDPITGERYRSTLKPVGEPYATKTVRIDTGEITESVLEPATDEELEATRKVMGGEDWQRWVDALSAAGALAPGFRTVAFSYIGPEVTHPIYRSGTIGLAKADLEATARRLDKELSASGGGAWVSVNAAAVTQSSAAIPAVPLYLSFLLPIAGDAGTFEDPAEQMRRLFDDHLGSGRQPDLDGEGRIRLDGWELDPGLQQEIRSRWERVDDTNFPALGNFPAFSTQFRRLFGFDVEGVDYEAGVDPDVPLD